MNNHKRRIDELERTSGVGSKVWHRVVQHIGQSSDEAISAYNAENPVPKDEDRAFIVMQIVTPEMVAAERV